MNEAFFNVKTPEYMGSRCPLACIVVETCSILLALAQIFPPEKYFLKSKITIKYSMLQTKKK